MTTFFKIQYFLYLFIISSLSPFFMHIYTCLYNTHNLEHYVNSDDYSNKQTNKPIKKKRLKPLWVHK